MTKSRIDINSQLVSILGSGNVYFQPPENVKMQYPCIVYTRTSMDSIYADDNGYIDYDTYNLTYISKDPDSQVPRELMKLPMTSFDRHFVADNLHHTVITMRVY